MNESTLVPRQEMSDLDWLARNVHVWDDKYDFVSRWHNGAVVWAVYPNGAAMYHKSEWLARRAELQNKPSFADHPNAKCFVQCKDGKWFKNTETSYVYSVDSGDWMERITHSGWVEICQGEVLGDWRDTLEKRPEQAELEPFVSMEDAATSKQHDPVNNPSHYASGGIECIESIKASMSHEAFLGYLKGNVQKYTWRYEKKVNPAEDLKKARWYLDKLIEEQK